MNYFIGQMTGALGKENLWVINLNFPEYGLQSAAFWTITTRS